MRRVSKASAFDGFSRSNRSRKPFREARSKSLEYVARLQHSSGRLAETPKKRMREIAQRQNRRGRNVSARQNSLKLDLRGHEVLDTEQRLRDFGSQT